MEFSSLGLSESILQAVTEQGYTKASPIQAKAIPPVLEGRDVMAAAQTGTGKTAGFTLPMLELLSKGDKPQSNQARALVLTPTRELAAQVQESVYQYSKHTALRSDVVFGGVKINPQMQRLRRGVDVLVATPGRLLDLHSQNAIKFNQLEVLVLDEADRMLDMGFIHDLKRIMKLLPKNRQTLLFSATFSPEIRELAKGFVRNPVEVSVTPPNSTVKKIEQWIYAVDKGHKTKLLIDLIVDNNWEQVLVFSKTKHGANKITKQLNAIGITASPIHGNKSQSARTKALADFKSGAIRVLVATDIAARGLDIEQLPHVVNYDLPNVPEDYVHRIGRTGRAGASGEAISLVCSDEDKLLFDIERLIGELLERRTINGYVPTHPLKQSRLNPRPKKPKKPKKPKVNHQDGQRSGENRSGHNSGHNAGQKTNQNPQANRGNHQGSRRGGRSNATKS